MTDFTPRFRLLPCLIAGIFPFCSQAAEPRLTTDQVVVTATRMEQNSFDLPVSIDQVSGEMLRDSRPMVNLTETSTRIPGVVVNNRFNAAQDLAISSRGFGARASFGVRGMRIYADGIPITMPDGQGQTGTFNLDTAKSVEFMRGPFSALYGNSSGGVVQIITRDGAQEPTLSSAYTAGSFDTRRGSIGFEGQVGGLNYILNATDYESDGYRDHSQSSRETFHAKLRYAFDAATKLTLVGTSLKQDAQDPLGLTQAQYDRDPRQAGTNAIARNTRVSRKHDQAGVVLEHAFSSENRLTLLGYSGTRDNKQFQTLGPTGRVAAIDREFSGTELKWAHRSTLAGRPFSLVAGMNYDRMKDVRTQFAAVGGVQVGNPTRNELQEAHNFDQFVQASYEPGEKWLVIAGVRHTRVEFDIKDRIPVPADGSGNIDFSNTSPVLGVTYRLTPAVNLYANYGRGFETPTFIEMTYSNPATFAGPNLGLSPSKSQNYEIGAKALIMDNTRANLALYRIDTDDEIATNVGFGATASFKNVGKTQRTGAELSIDSALPYNFNVYGAFSWMNAEFKDNFVTGGVPIISGNTIPGTYRSTAYTEISWTHPASGFSTALEGVRFSETYTNDSNAQKADGYTLINLRAGFVQKVSGWQFREFLRVENLADKTYVSSVRVNAAQNTTGAAFESGAERNWFAGISASYAFR